MSTTTIDRETTNAVARERGLVMSQPVNGIRAVWHDRTCIGTVYKRAPEEWVFAHRDGKHALLAHRFRALRQMVEGFVSGSYPAQRVLPGLEGVAWKS